MQFPPIYILNLDRDTKRWETITRQLQPFGVSYTRVAGIYGKDLTLEQVDAVTTPLCGKTCTLSTVGCAASHRKAWQQILDDGHDYALILEDDARPLPGLLEKFQEYSLQFPQEWDVLYLGCNGACTMEPYTFIEGLMYVGATMMGQTKPYQKLDTNLFVPSFSVGSHAYMVSKRFCEFMVHQPIGNHVDLEIFMQKQFPTYAVSPKLFCTNSDLGSNIAEYHFPHGLSYLASFVKSRNEYDLAWALSEPQFRLGDIPFNGMLYLFFIAGIVFRWCHLNTVWFWAWILVESSIALAWNLSFGGLGITLFAFYLGYIV